MVAAPAACDLPEAPRCETCASSIPCGCENQRRFGQLVLEIYPQLVRYARWRCGRTDGADDLVQETLLRAWRGIGQLRDEDSVRAWVFTILRREFARAAVQRPQPTVSLDEVSEGEMPRYEHDGADEMAVREALNRIDSKYRVPLMLQVLSGMNCREIGAALGLSETAVMTRLFRARKRMQELLPARRGTP